ncbi:MULTISPECIES: DUF6233 domain-containing protein [unclassified Streptomyces]|nr:MULTISPECIES: DUF6233 domain-containing protein [unclassified Streptomyces]
MDRDQALRGLAKGVAACPRCRPDTELGVLGQGRSGRSRGPAEVWTC